MAGGLRTLRDLAPSAVPAGDHCDQRVQGKSGKKNFNAKTQGRHEYKKKMGFLPLSLPCGSLVGWFAGWLVRWLVGSLGDFV